LVVAAYAAFPPTHGGAHRLHRLLEFIARRYRIILLTDEEESYRTGAARWFKSFQAVHLIGGRKGAPIGEPPRIARMRSHSHAALEDEVRRLAAIYRPDLVLVEYIELALLARCRNGRIPWVLTLHDVLLSEDSRQLPEDSFERDALRKFDHLIACCKKTRRSWVGCLPPSYRTARPIRPASTRHPLGTRTSCSSAPSATSRIGRASSSCLSGVARPLSAPAPSHSQVASTRRSRAERGELFQQPGVYVYDHVDDVLPWISDRALTINPIRNNRGSCLKVIQSLAAGRVCVSNREGARGFLESGFRSLVAVDTMAEFVEAISWLLNHPDARSYIEAPEPVRLEPYSWVRAAEQQMAVYRRLIRPRRYHHD
jgi:hypothetical protein